jgi:glycosyltransferase involved in cell wall biosynthesis
MHYFQDVTLLITHYNRSSSLERLLKAFKDLQCSFGDIVVSDDGSKPEHQDAIRNLKNSYDFQLVSTPKNKGLGNNINKGQRAVKTPYTIYVQEDFVPTALFAPRLAEALGLMNKDESLDFIRFYAYNAYPYLKPYAPGFAEIIYKPWFIRTDKIYCYSDHPHLRRSSFLEKFGPYTEGKKVDKTEYLMCVAFIQHKGKGLFFRDYKSLFTQLNSPAEPSTVTRSQWRHSGSPLISCLRFTYRTIKYNYDLHLSI